METRRFFFGGLAYSWLGLIPWEAALECFRLSPASIRKGFVIDSRCVAAADCLHLSKDFHLENPSLLQLRRTNRFRAVRNS